MQDLVRLKDKTDQFHRFLNPTDFIKKIVRFTDWQIEFTRLSTFIH